jgi:hypothetical protein
MMFTFPDDCLQDASAGLLALFELKPQETAMWVKSTIEMLPAGSVKPGEGERLFNGIGQKIQNGEMRKIRILLQGMFCYLVVLFWFEDLRFDCSGVWGSGALAANRRYA